MSDAVSEHINEINEINDADVVKWVSLEDFAEIVQIDEEALEKLMKGGDVYDGNLVPLAKYLQSLVWSLTHALSDLRVQAEFAKEILTKTVSDRAPLQEPAGQLVRAACSVLEEAISRFPKVE